MGIDASICIETFEPWVVEVYNATEGGPLVTKRIVRRGPSVEGGVGQSNNATEEVQIEVESIDEGGKGVVSRMTVGKMLSSVDRFQAFDDGHQNAVNQMLKVHLSFTSLYRKY